MGSYGKHACLASSVRPYVSVLVACCLGVQADLRSSLLRIDCMLFSANVLVQVEKLNDEGVKLKTLQTALTLMQSPVLAENEVCVAPFICVWYLWALHAAVVMPMLYDDHMDLEGAEV